MPAYKANLLACISILLTSCVFSPQYAHEQSYADKCNTFTKKLTLSSEQIEHFNINIHHPNKNDLSALLVTLGAIIPVGSFIISGSIVLVGNSLHWLEYQGSCEDGLLLRNIP